MAMHNHDLRATRYRLTLWFAPCLVVPEVKS
jgi:hypothetical protein